MYITWKSRSAAPVKEGRILAYRGLTLGLVLTGWFVVDFPYKNLIYGLFTLTVMTGYTHVYTLLWEKLVYTGEWSISLWTSCVVMFFVALSLVWNSLSTTFPTDAAKALSINIHRQDLMIGAFVLLCGLLFDKIKDKNPLHTMINSWLLPFASIWFTLETKLLANLGGGSPFHMSWPFKNLGPYTPYTSIHARPYTPYTPIHAL
jgi:hypothetical protein